MKQIMHTRSIPKYDSSNQRETSCHRGPVKRALRFSEATVPSAHVSVFLFLLISAISLAVGAQQEPGSDTLFWYDGDIRREIHVRKDLTAEIVSDPDVTQSQQKLSATPVNAHARVRIRKVGSTHVFQKATSSEVAIGGSPVFSDASPAGPLRALPGGIVVTFEDHKTEEDLRAWASENDLVLDRVLPTAPLITASFMTAPGLVSLATANRVRLLQGVAAAQPNWWTEKWKGDVSPVGRENSNSDAHAVQTIKRARQGASKRFGAKLPKTPAK